MNLEFTPREELSEYEWNPEGRNWKRLDLDKEVVRQLAKRSTWNGLWHNTEHITRLYNVNDQRLCTRSIKVGPLVHLIYWGLGDHIDHHVYPQVPSRNLPKLHKLLQHDLPEPLSMIDCWREMFAVAKGESVPRI